MELQDAIAAWLDKITKEAQAVPPVPVVEDPDPPMPQGRLLIDGKATRHAIFDSVREAVTKRFPIENDNYRIDLKDVKYEGPTHYTLEQQKQALLHNRRLGCSLVGTWRLTDKKTGAVLDERRDAVMRVPYYTNRGTIINNGSEYTVISQARLSPGVYTRKKQNGDLEVQFNVANGRGFRFELDKSTGRIAMRMGQANLPLYPVLKAMGVSDDELKKSWGAEVAYANSQKNDPRALQKLYSKVAGFKADPNATPQVQADYIKTELAKFGLDPNTVVRTMGLEGITGVTPALMVRAAQKILNINRGLEEADNRDNPRFSKFYGIEHMLAERVSKDAAKLIRPMLFKVGRDKNLARIGRNALGPYIDDFLSTSGLAQPGEEANPMSILVQQSRITRTGEGGISSPDLITPEARGVQGDYLGFVDFLAGPESSSAGVDVRGAYGTVLGKDNKLYNIFRNLKTGKKEYLSLDAAADKTIAFPDQDPKSPYLYCMRNGVPSRVKSEEVDYMVPSFSRTIGAGINMNPMPTAVFGMRSFYSSKFWEQYLPQKKGEVPLVDSLMPNGKMTFNEYYGRKIGCVTAPFAGTVTKVTPDSIVITGKNGKQETIDLVTNYPHNRMTQFSFFPTVKKGDTVEEGSILAHSNFTDAKTGAFNMGQNLKVAIMTSPKGVSSFEDALVISESAAKRMATSRLFNFDQDTKNGIKISKNKYLAAFPKTFTKEQADKLDDNGVVKVGTELHRGDPILVAVGPKLLSAENAQLGKLSSVLKNAVTDKSQTWEHDWPGIVTDVVSGPTGATVLIKSEPSITVGDKMCYDDQTEVLTSHGWKSMKDVTLDDNIATMNPETFEFDYIKPDLVRKYEHSGEMYCIKNSCLDLLVTPNHRMFVKKRYSKEFGFEESRTIFGKMRSYKKDGLWKGTEVDTFTFPAYQVGHRWGLVTKPEVTVSMDTFLMILGMYLSEGSCHSSFKDGRNRGAGISIAQKKPATVMSGRKALEESGVEFRYDRTYGFHLPGRHWYNYFSQFGHAWEKYIPEFVFGLSVRQQEILFKWMMWGDGHCRNGRPKSYYTSSRRLADDFQRLCLHIGKAGRVIFREKAGAVHGAIEGRVITTRHDSYQVQVINSKLTPTVNHSHVSEQHVQIEKYVKYDGFVYCCTMPKWHAIYVRRNGHACWCGNSPRFALKGVVGGIIPDDKMPRDAVTNEPYDMLVNPMGFLSRIAPGQLMEIALGKVAKKTGKQIRIPQLPPPEGWLNWTRKQMADAGVAETADVFDPQTGRTIKGVGDGYMYVQAMHHIAEKKFSARGIEGSYTQDQQPAKGGQTGAKRISGFDQNALLSHGATEVIKDAMTIRGSKNSEYWRKLRLGLPIPEPEVPFVYQKFMNYLKAGGVNVVEKGDMTSVMPQTDKDIEELAEGRVIDSSQMVDYNFDPVKGGLFDLGKTGGMGGNRWSMIELPEPVPNPIMEEPVRRCLGLTVRKMQDILSGKEQLNGKTGGSALKAALANLDVDRVLEQARQDVKSKRGSSRDNAIKVLGYLSAAKEMKIRPEDWMISKVPVLPPAFRPISKAGDTALVPDTNELYKELIETKHNYEVLKGDLPDEALTDERLNVYRAVKAAFGLGHSVTVEGQAKNLKGPIKQIVGEVPKFGFAQSKIFAKNQDLVGRSVTVPDKNLDMDQVGIPEDMAWTMYKPFITRNLALRGYSPVDALKMVDERTPTAKSVLEKLMAEKPVLMDRAPTWHKFNIMAFKPFLVKGKEIHVSPLCDSPMNGDHDGNCIIGSIKITVRVKKFEGWCDDLNKIDERFNTDHNEIRVKNPIDMMNEKCYHSLIMKLTEKATLVVRGKDHIEFTLQIKDVPYLEETHRKDRHGADVYDTVPGMEVLSTDADGKGVRWEPFSWLTIENGCDLKKVTTTRGKDVTCSSNESIAAFDADKGLIRVKPDDIGERVLPVILGRPKSELEGSFELGWLVGEFLSDGWIRDGKVIISKKSLAIRSRFLDYIEKLTGSKDITCFASTQRAIHSAETNYGISGESYKLIIPCRLLPKYIIEIFKSCYERDWVGVSTAADRGCLHKLIPDSILSDGLKTRLGVLCGLLDGDGTFAISRSKSKTKPTLTVQLSTSSPNLRRTAMRLGNTLGISTSFSTIKCSAKRLQTHDSYQIIFASSGLKKYAAQINLADDHTEAIELLKNVTDSDIDIVPVGQKVFDIARRIPAEKLASYDVSRDSLATLTCRARKSSCGYITLRRSYARSILNAIDSEISEKSKEETVQFDLLKRIVSDETLCWEKVKTVESAPTETVYDIAVPGTKVFAIENGLVIYDTVNIHLPASEKASKEALEKMLPSKNLFSLTDMKSVRYKPEKEQVSGLWALTAGVSQKPVRVFRTKSDAIKAYRNGEIAHDDPIEIR